MLIVATRTPVMGEDRLNSALLIVTGTGRTARREAARSLPLVCRYRDQSSVTERLVRRSPTTVSTAPATTSSKATARYGVTSAE
jgi:hypothetical protein